MISVITPTYNRAHTIRKAIDSVMAQTYEDWEHIIVDDGSTDNTKHIVEAVKGSRVRYLRQNNGGPSKARNLGISKANGKWIMYLDSDDQLLPECMCTTMEWLEKYPETVFAFPRSTRTLELYEDGKLIKSVDDSDDTPPELTAQDLANRKAGLSPNGFIHLRKLYD